MKYTISKQNIFELIVKQLENLFDFDKAKEEILYEAFLSSLKKIELCFRLINNKYYYDDEDTIFSPFHSGQNTIFLYFLSKEVSKKDTILADKIYYLNKTLNCVDLFYAVDLPDVFFLDHPLGAIMGRAKYSNFFCFSQGCTVGNNKGVYPRFGENVTMLSNSKILGNCNIGNNVIVSAGTYIKDENIDDNSLVFGSSPNLIIKEINNDYIKKNMNIFNC